MAKKKKLQATVGDTELDNQPSKHGANGLPVPQLPSATQSTLVICRNKYVPLLIDPSDEHLRDNEKGRKMLTKFTDTGGTSPLTMVHG